MEKLRTRFTYANVIATLALFIALGGGAYAAVVLPKNSVGSKQLKKNSVTAAKIKDGAVSGAKIDLASLGTVPSAARSESASSAARADLATNAANAVHADSATSAGSAATANALGGKPASAFAAANVVRTATVLADGTISASRSDGIAQANIIGPHTPGSGFYCIDGLDPIPTAAVATISFGASPQATVYTEVTPAGEPGCNVYVATYAAGLAADAPFTLLIH